VLRVVQQRGAVLKPCTGRTDSLLCCDLQVVTQTVGCALDCSYCVLQGYQNRSQITVTADSDRLLERLVAELAQQPRRLHRVCTGQVADSLALEPELGFAARAVERLAAVPNVLLELKTKTAQVQDLLNLDHRGRTAVSWSLSPEEVARAEEHGCAPLPARLEAAGRVASAGYLVGFHLDPMITGADFAADVRRYRLLARQALAAVPPGRVSHVSLGSVRYLPAMGRTLAARFPQSRVPLGELFPDVDGKLRLLAPLRVALYREVAAEVRAACPEAFLYLCMEPPAIWRRALGAGHRDAAELDRAFSASLQRRFGLAPHVVVR
jgi:spore photoproduct lyase